MWLLLPRLKYIYLYYTSDAVRWYQNPRRAKYAYTEQPGLQFMRVK